MNIRRVHKSVGNSRKVSQNPWTHEYLTHATITTSMLINTIISYMIYKLRLQCHLQLPLPNIEYPTVPFLNAFSAAVVWWQCVSIKFLCIATWPFLSNCQYICEVCALFLGVYKWWFREKKCSLTDYMKNIHENAIQFELICTWVLWKHDCMHAPKD